MPQSWIKVTVPSDFQRAGEEKTKVHFSCRHFTHAVSDQDLAKHGLPQMHFTTEASMEHGDTDPLRYRLRQYMLQTVTKTEASIQVKTKALTA